MVYIQIPPHPVFRQNRVVVKTIFRRGIMTGSKRVLHNLNSTQKLRRHEKNPPTDRRALRSFEELKSQGDVKIK